MIKWKKDVARIEGCICIVWFGRSTINEATYNIGPFDILADTQYLVYRECIGKTWEDVLTLDPQYFGETNESVNEKVKVALEYGLAPIMCVGEKLEEREKGVTNDVVKDHVVNGLKDISKDKVVHVTIAYEPVWAIGTGRTATPEQAEEVHAFIRGLLKELYDEETAQAVVIQYGGSVKPENVKDLMAKENIDGGLIGGASLKADSFEAIVKHYK